MANDVLRRVAWCVECHGRVGIALVRSLLDSPSGRASLACPLCHAPEDWSGGAGFRVERTVVALRNLDSHCDACGSRATIFHTDGMVMSQYWHCPIVGCQSANLAELSGEIWAVTLERR